MARIAAGAQPIALSMRSLSELRRQLDVESAVNRTITTWLKLFLFVICAVIANYATEPRTPRETWVQLCILLGDIMYYITMELRAQLTPPPEVSDETWVTRRALVIANERVRILAQPGTEPAAAILDTLNEVAVVAQLAIGDAEHCAINC